MDKQRTYWPRIWGAGLFVSKETLDFVQQKCLEISYRSWDIYERMFQKKGYLHHKTMWKLSKNDQNQKFLMIKDPSLGLQVTLLPPLCM